MVHRGDMNSALGKCSAYSTVCPALIPLEDKDGGAKRLIIFCRGLQCRAFPPPLRFYHYVFSVVGMFGFGS